MTAPQNSDERIEDVCFENLIRRWTALRQWDWVTAANVMYGHILEERMRDEPVEGVVVDEFTGPHAELQPGWGDRV